MSIDHTQVFAPGTLLADKYVVETCIAQGGMGTVYRARNVDLDAPVALKVMRHVDDACEQEIVGRTLREAKLAAKLRGEHIARVLDAGRLAEGPPYIVMEYLEGRDLRQVLDDEGPLDVADAVEVIQQACEGLAEAHDNGIVHRDLKPENLFLARRPNGSAVIKLLDFGISKDTIRPTGRCLTGPNSVIGSPEYMSPEQLDRPDQVDARADVWALGCVLFELLTGSSPFDGPTAAAICSRALQSPMPSLRSDRSDVPERLEGVVRRCLEKDRVARFACVAALSHALSEFASGEGMLLGSTASTTSPPPSREPEPSFDSLDGAVFGRQGVASVYPVADPRRPARGGWLILFAAAVLVVTGLASPAGRRAVDAAGTQLVSPEPVRTLDVGVAPVVAQALAAVALRFAEDDHRKTADPQPVTEPPRPLTRSAPPMTEDEDIYAPLDRLFPTERPISRKRRVLP